MQKINNLILQFSRNICYNLKKILLNFHTKKNLIFVLCEKKFLAQEENIVPPLEVK
jgi:hypothetical protein